VILWGVPAGGGTPQGKATSLTKWEVGPEGRGPGRSRKRGQFVIERLKKVNCAKNKKKGKTWERCNYFQGTKQEYEVKGGNVLRERGDSQERGRAPDVLVNKHVSSVGMLVHDTSTHCWG